MAKAPQATFEVRFVAPGLIPAKVPLHAVSEALAAVQDLASGRDPFETRHVPPEKAIGLVKVRRGSAVYSCVAREPEDAYKNLARVGNMLSELTQETIGGESELMVAAFRPIETLSTVARNVGCRVEIARVDKKEHPMVVVDSDAFKKLSNRLLLKGETTVLGTVVRVGGATGMRCLMRVAGRHRILYCDVESRELVRNLGQHLYEQIAATGTATWIHRSWYIYEFTIRGFTQPALGDAESAINALRDAGLNAWDKIKDPESYIGKLRE